MRWARPISFHSTWAYSRRQSDWCKAVSPHRVQEFEIGVSANRSRGWNAGAAGYPILTPAIDMIEVGTGGGSLAWVDDGGRLRVGPRSAGADPGPSCYGRGGKQPAPPMPTCCSGRIDPGYFLGGEMVRCRRGTSRDRRVGSARRTGDVGLRRRNRETADAAMAQALRVVSVQRGHEPARLGWFRSGAQVHCTRWLLHRRSALATVLAAASRRSVSTGLARGGPGRRLRTDRCSAAGHGELRAAGGGVPPLGGQGTRTAVA